MTIPRRSQVERWHPAERAIYDAAQLVERMGTDPRLTQAQNLLGMARNKVADFIDGVEDVHTSMILSECEPVPPPRRGPTDGHDPR